MWWWAEVSAVDQPHQPRLGAAASCSLAVADVQLAEPAPFPSFSGIYSAALMALRMQIADMPPPARPMAAQAASLSR
jgi:hypothetical protein